MEPPKKKLIRKKEYREIDIFIFRNSFEEVSDGLIIRLFGKTKEKTNTGYKYENVYLRIDDYPVYLYVELPEKLSWTPTRAQCVCDAFNHFYSSASQGKPVRYQLEPHKKRLYYAWKEKNPNYKPGSTLPDEKYLYRDKTFPFLRVEFRNTSDSIRFSKYLSHELNIDGVGKYRYKIYEMERSLDPWIKLSAQRDIPICGWAHIKGEIIQGLERESVDSDVEMNCSWKCLSPSLRTDNIPMTVLSFDIEANASITSSMPKSSNPDDKVFMISLILAHEDGTVEKYLHSLGHPSPSIVGLDVNLVLFTAESALHLSFSEFVKKHKVNVIIGYNILGWDFKYMIERCKTVLGCYDDFSQLGCLDGVQDTLVGEDEKDGKFESKAYGAQKLFYLDAEGRLMLDLLPMIKREGHRIANYRLGTVTTHFGLPTKDPLSPKDLFEYYKSHDPEKWGLMGKYCVQDAYITYLLFQKLQMWVGQCEMARTACVPIFSLFTKGTQLQMYAQCIRYCLKNNFIIWNNVYFPDEKHMDYMGAIVLEPISGRYKKVISEDFCFSGNTLITLSTGCSRRIDSIQHQERVLGCDEKLFLQDYPTINGLQCKGTRETIKVWLQDGTILTCTPDHRIMLDNGEWCPANQLKGKYIRCGLESPEDKVCPLESTWEMKVGDTHFHMKDYPNRERTLVFARMLGFILTDGCIYISKDHGRNRKCTEAYFGTLYDALSFRNDMQRFIPPSHKPTSIRKRGKGKIKGITYSISVPQMVATIIHGLEGIMVGKRATQPMKLPLFVCKEDCPLSIVREFLGGLMGGDGTAPHLTGANKFGFLSFKWTTIEKYKEDMSRVFETLKNLFSRFNIHVNMRTPIKIKYRSPQCIKPTDYEANPRWDYGFGIGQDDTLLFHRTIGLRYCVNKSCRLTVAGSYLTMSEKTRDQHQRVLDFTVETLQQNAMSIREALDIVRKDVFQDEPILNIYSQSSVQDIRYQRTEAIRHKDRPRRLSLQPKHFPTPSEYLDETQTRKWFDSGTYTVTTEETHAPTFRKKVIDIRPGIPQTVYDIEVDVVHSFIASGVVSHNCSLYPSIIMAYNTCMSTFIDDPAIPDEHCHVFAFEEHSACSHDESRKKLKNGTFSKAKRKVICEKHHFRFLKEEYGGKGVIPSMVYEHITSRKATRKEKEKNRETIRNHVKVFLYVLESGEESITTNIKSFLDKLKAEDKEILVDAEKEYKEEKEHSDIPSTQELLSSLNICDDLLMLNKTLEKRQGAKKVCANAQYGATGVKKGFLPFLPVASSVTYKGREAIKFMAAKIPELYKGKTVYGDSVTGDTPILLQEPTGRIIFKTIGSVEGWSRCENGKFVSEDWNGFKVWSSHGWTPIHRVIRHKTSKTLFRVNTGHGLVTVTEDHSLLTPENNEIKPKDCHVGTELRHGYPVKYKVIHKKDGFTKSQAYNIGKQLDIDHVPTWILNTHKSVQDGFLEGYLHTHMTYSSSSPLVLAGLYLLLIQRYPSIKISWDKDIGTLTPQSLSAPNIIQSISILPPQGEIDVYDITTEDHTFQAGVGSLIVHNTDSCMVYFPHIKNNKELTEYAKYVAAEITKHFPPPMKLEFERIYEDYMILTKKRYIATVANEDGVIIDTIKKGLALARRDNCPLLKDIYLKGAKSLLVCKTQQDEEEIMYHVIQQILTMFRRGYPLEKFVITKSIAKDEYKTKTLPAHVALSKRMMARGVQVGNGSRIEYVFTTRYQGQKSGFPQGDKVEDYDYFKLMRETGIYQLDYLYYVEKQLIKPLDELLRVGFQVDPSQHEDISSLVEQKHPYYGAVPCQEQPCSNRGFYLYQSKYVCGKHIPFEERTDATRLQRKRCPIMNLVEEQYRYCYNYYLCICQLHYFFSPYRFGEVQGKRSWKPLERKKTDEQKQHEKQGKEQEKERKKQERERKKQAKASSASTKTKKPRKPRKTKAESIAEMRIDDPWEGIG